MLAAATPCRRTRSSSVRHSNVFNCPSAERPCYAARIEGRSSFARVGLLVHFTAPTIHAGFDGTIALEMINLAEYPISLFPAMEICQLIVEDVQPMPCTKPSEFQGQSTPTGR